MFPECWQIAQKVSPDETVQRVSPNEMLASRVSPMIEIEYQVSPIEMAALNPPCCSVPALSGPRNDIVSAAPAWGGGGNYFIHSSCLRGLYGSFYIS
jgi:hypothetical protein